MNPRPDIAYHPVRIPIVDDEAIIGYLLIGTDNTARKQATAQAEAQSEAIRASELSYRRLFEAAKDGILILDVDTGRINAVNPFLVKLLGCSPSEMVGKTVGRLGPFKDIESNKGMRAITRGRPGPLRENPRGGI